MLKNYNPEEVRGMVHVLKATYMIDAAQIIVRIPMHGTCTGYDILDCIDGDSDWLGELPDCDNIELIGIDKLDYDAGLDMLPVTYASGYQHDIDGSEVKDYLVKIEIEAVKPEKDEE